MVKQRNEIDEKYQWDLSTIFATDQDWEEEAASLATDIKAASHFSPNAFGYNQCLFGIEPSFRKGLCLCSYEK